MPPIERQIRGPLMLETSPALAARLRSLRHRVYTRRLPHLLERPLVARDVALRMDARAWHFVAEDGEGLGAALRLVERPFELEQVCPGLECDLDRYPAHLEISRFLVDGATAADPLLATRLLAAAGRWSRGRQSTGFWALCSSSRARVFRRLGMTRVREDLELPERAGRTYTLLEGSFEALARVVERRLMEGER